MKEHQPDTFALMLMENTMSLSCSFLLDDNYCFLFFILSRKASVKLAQE